MKICLVCACVFRVCKRGCFNENLLNWQCPVTSFRHATNLNWHDALMSVMEGRIVGRIYGRPWNPKSYAVYRSPINDLGPPLSGDGRVFLGGLLQTWWIITTFLPTVQYCSHSHMNA